MFCRQDFTADTDITIITTAYGLMHIMTKKIALDDYHLPEDDNHHSHRRGNLKSYKIALLLKCYIVYSGKFSWRFVRQLCLHLRGKRVKWVWIKYCQILGICVNYKMGFWIWWSNLFDRYTTYYINSQITIFDWTLSTSDHSTLIQYSWSHSHSLLYRLGSDVTEITSTA
jgi:hypothetical protein